MWAADRNDSPCTPMGRLFASQGYMLKRLYAFLQELFCLWQKSKNKREFLSRQQKRKSYRAELKISVRMDLRELTWILWNRKKVWEIAART